MLLSDLNVILASLNFISIIDIFLVALVIFWILTLLQGTRAVQLLRGILILSILAIISASVLNNLTAFSWLVNKALPALLVAIPVIFQPELRRALERVGRTGKVLAGGRPQAQIEEAISAVSAAAVALSGLQHGGLIVFERETGLEDYIESGERLDARVSPLLLTTIFYPGTALHDGAVIIRGEKVVAAAVVLPLGGNIATDMRLLGTRHRAALGITESTDAIAVVVSEETGLISVAHNGKLIKGVDQRRLEQLLRAFFRNQLLDDTLAGGKNNGRRILKRLGFGQPDADERESRSSVRH
ncbi:MAG: TIGR00159 family protein [Chloroflexi bacterium]|nr:MAG: TIGR00159 family protein [Chloroflexota bacterium]